MSYSALDWFKYCLCMETSCQGLPTVSPGTRLHRLFRFNTNHSHAAKLQKKKKKRFLDQKPFHHAKHFSLEDVFFFFSKPLVLLPWGDEVGEEARARWGFPSILEIRALGGCYVTLEHRAKYQTNKVHPCFKVFVFMAMTDRHPSRSCLFLLFMRVDSYDGCGPRREWILMSTVKSNPPPPICERGCFS